MTKTEIDRQVLGEKLYYISDDFKLSRGLCIEVEERHQLNTGSDLHGKFLPVMVRVRISGVRESVTRKAEAVATSPEELMEKIKTYK